MLNSEQQRAVEAVRGPVCILAGRRVREDDDDHAPGRKSGREQGFSRRRDPRGHVHRQGGRRDARTARAARGPWGSVCDLPRGGARAAPVLRRRAAGADPRLEGAPAPLHRELAPAAVSLPAGGRPGDRGRMGEEPAHHARRLSELAGGAPSADPGGPDAPRLHRVRAAQGARRLGRLRGPARADHPALRRGPRRAGASARPLPGVHRRRVPGRQPAPADAARPLARRARRAVRGRRRLPVDLRVHGREPRASARDAGAVSARDGRPARGELPLDPGDPRVREPPRPEARRRRKGAAGDAGSRPGADDALVRRAIRRSRVSRRARPRAPRLGSAVRGDGDPVPHERALGRLRGGAERGGDPVTGRGAPLPGGREAVPESAPRAGRSRTPGGSPSTRGCSRGSPTGSASGK